MRREWLEMINAKTPEKAAYWRDAYRIHYGERVEGSTYEEVVAKRKKQEKEEQERRYRQLFEEPYIPASSMVCTDLSSMDPVLLPRCLANTFVDLN